ncbi:MAG: c-type cytochrome biogenesis protein CcmI [Pseudomonadota bacterium]|nr:c-type cytochrome biogenesis protein CcmI [Pseudomonadota bacterium]
MVLFWIIVAVFVLLALAFVIPPLLKKQAITVTHHMNVAVYQQQLGELAEEALTPEHYHQAKQELDSNLLQELPQETQLSYPARGRWASVIAVVIILPILAMSIYLSLGTPQQLIPPQAVRDEPTPSLEDAVNKLAARLQNHPKDQQGWYMLARSYAVMKHYEAAAQAYDKVLALTDEADAQLLTDYAETLALSRQGNLAGQPIMLLKTALEVEPNYQKALWLLGFALAQKQDFQAAIEYWQRFLEQVPEEEQETRKMVHNYIQEAQAQLATTTPTPQADAQADNTAQLTEETAFAEPKKITVHVTLAPELHAQVAATDTVFIYARALQGPPMPLALVKTSVEALPTTVTLDDTMAMVPAMHLSTFDKVTVLARVSNSGQATIASGDLQGQVTPVTVGSPKTVEVTIDHIVP